MTDRTFNRLKACKASLKPLAFCFLYGHEMHKMKCFTDYSAKYIKTERNVLNPLPGLTFVSVSYYETPYGIVGIVS